MPRYIDADNIKLKGISVFDQNLEILIPLSDVRKSLQMTPTADVQEVKHGHWITKDLVNLKIECKCSECGYIGISNYDSYDDPYDFNYCPNCGTKMDGKEDEAENKEVEE